MNERSSTATEKVAYVGLWILIGYTLIQDLRGRGHALLVR